MSNDKVVDFPTTGTVNIEGPPMPNNAVPTPEQLQEMQQKGGQEILELIQKNRKSGQENLQRASDQLETLFRDIRQHSDGKSLMTMSSDDGKLYFSLENTLRTVKKGIDGALTSVEAVNSLVDMIISDLGGVVHNLSQTQKAMVVANSHTQTLLELLKDKGIVTESELKTTWDKLIAEKQEEFKKLATESNQQ